MRINNTRGAVMLFIIAAIAIALSAGLTLYIMNKPEIENTGTKNDTQENSVTEKIGSPTEKEGDLMIIDADTGENILKFSTTNLAGSTSPLLDFNTKAYNEFRDSYDLVVLYFYANWCPICKAELPHLYGAFNDLKEYSVIGFRVNFNDNETDDDERNLAREFGVAYQHTKVFLKGGKRILKAPDSWENKERYLNEIQKALGQ